ncbi:MAG: hypothetical protein RL758_351 [Pseudomonadota bacterium]|jgi:hypothetical protein
MPTNPTPITSLPTAPSRADPANFAARADAFLGALGAFGTQTNAVGSATYTNAVEAAAAANAAQADRVLAQSAAAAVAAQSPASNAAAAASSAAAAAVSAGQAMAVSPDSPVRFNSRRISANLTIGSNYNAASTGPISVDDGITVTVQDHATWSIQ